MTDLTDVQLVRGALANLCRNPATRITGRALDTANRWQPYAVRHPQTHMYFSDAGAWDYIADCLVAGCCLTCIPPSSQYQDHAYYMIEPQDEKQKIYMKVAIRPPLRMVIGLSFHYEDPR